MRKTTFAGLTVLEPTEGLDTDNGSFIGRDRDNIDRLLHLGATLHRHNGKAGLSNPTLPASAAIVASGGVLPSDLALSLGYTIVDSQEGETMLSPLAVVSTGSPMDAPIAAPSAAVDYTGGSLLVDTYYYALTWTDGEGGETPTGPAIAAERAPGFASGRIILTNLNYAMESAGAIGWRLYRAKGGGSFDFLTSGGVADDEFIDDGSQEVDCDDHPPTDAENNTRQFNSLLVTLPKADSNMAKAMFVNLYVSLSGDFGEASLLGQYPIASAGATLHFPDLSELLDRAPPDVNLSVGGASLIDPDTELLDWHWRRPVSASGLLGSGVVGDVKLVTGTGQLYGVLAPSASAAVASEWVRLGSAAAAAPATPKWTASAASGNPGVVPNIDALTFVGSGAAKVSLVNQGAGSAQVVITLPQEPPPAGGSAWVASGVGGTVVDVKKLTVVPSGWIQPRLSEPVPGEARITVLPSAAIDLEVAAQSAGTPQNWLRWLVGGNPALPRAEIWGANRSSKAGSPNAFAELYLVVNRLRQATSGYLFLEARNNTSSSARLELLSGSPNAIRANVNGSEVTVLDGNDQSSFLKLDEDRSERDFGLVTELPESPELGDRCYFIAEEANGIVWHLIYDGVGEFPWKKIGGPPLFAEATGSVSTSSSSYVSLSGDPQVEIWLDGDYMVRHGCRISQSTNGCSALMGLSFGGAAVASSDWVDYYAGASVSGGQAVWANVVRERRKTKLSNSFVRAQYRQSGGGTALFSDRWISVDPIRVG